MVSYKKIPLLFLLSTLLAPAVWAQGEDAEIPPNLQNTLNEAQQRQWKKIKENTRARREAFASTLTDVQKKKMADVEKAKASLKKAKKAFNASLTEEQSSLRKSHVDAARLEREKFKAMLTPEQKDEMAVLRRHERKPGKGKVGRGHYDDMRKPGRP